MPPPRTVTVASRPGQICSTTSSCTSESYGSRAGTFGLMKVAVTGSSGLIGSTLVPGLEGAGHDVLRLVRRPARGAGEIGWDPAAGTIDLAALAGVDALVHLAGANIGTRWTEAKKRVIRTSRTEGTRLVAETAAALDPRPQVLVCASAIGFYGDRGDEGLTGGAAQGGGVLSGVVGAWGR